MIVVIQCAARKQRDAGHMIAPDGRPVMFVANPKMMLFNDGRIYARPDDYAGGGKSWRQLVAEYNKTPDYNPFRLCPACVLYERGVYRRLVGRFGMSNVYVLSAGWGLIPADFLTPNYDITFSANVEPYKRRLADDMYDDFRMLPRDRKDDVVFLGGKDYLPLFYKLTDGVASRRVVFYNSRDIPRADRCKFRRFDTTTRTNWHYACAEALIDGSITI
ncbi:MAG: hypothetical protein GC201_13270 [Alphaproteobacteria bacterium]|nr:hypothetical protein [Alphaproteobacteria bacterium]